jgi:hypothetical protein
MPTVLDELVVAVRLDPSQFTEGQRKTLAEFDKLKAAAQSSTQQIGATTATTLHEHLGAIHNELKDVNLGLLSLGANSRRTGQSIRASGLSGAEGLTSLATAGLAAYAALKSVQETISAIGGAAGQGAQTARAAQFTNLPVQWLSAFEQYAFSAGNVPFATTEGTLNAFEQKRQQYKLTGSFPEEFTALARFVGLSPAEAATMPMQELLARVAARLGQNPTAEAQAIATSAGLGPLTATLSRGETALQQGVQSHMDTALTRDQADALLRLQGSINDVTTAWQHLQDTIIADNPEWVRWLNSFHDLLTWMSNTKEGAQTVQTAAEVVSFAIGITMVAAVRKLVLAVLAGNSALLASPFGRFLLIPWALSEVGAFTPPIPHQGQNEQDKALENAPTPSGYRRPQGFEWLNPLNWIHGVPTSYTSGGAPVTATGTGTVGTGASGFGLQGLSPDDITIMRRESRGDPNVGTGSGGAPVDLTNYPHDATGFPIWQGTVDPHTGLRSHAAGLYQIEPALWRHYAPMVGVTDFSPESQQKVRNAIKAHEGNVPWAASGVVMPVQWAAAPTPGPQVASAGASNAPPSGGTRLPSMSSKFVFGTDTPPPGAGKPNFDWSGRENAADLARVRAEIEAARSVRQAQASGGASSTTSNTSVSTGPISVVTQSDHPLRVGNAVQRAVQGAIVSQANMGQSG